MKKQHLAIILGMILAAITTIHFANKNSLGDQLFAATRIHDLGKVKALIADGANIDARDNAGQTPLHSAVYRGFVDIAAFYIENGADLEAKDNRGGTPLHWAAMNKQPYNIVLLMQNGADANAVDVFDMTPLNWAVAQGNADNVKALLDMGADPKRENHLGKKALDYAKERKDQEVIRLLSR